MFSPMEFIEKLASMIPPPYKHQVNYYGCLSSHSKLRPDIVGCSVAESTGKGDLQQECQNDCELEVESDDSSVLRYIPWAELLKRTFGIDLFIWPKCGLQVIAAIVETEAVFKILGHFGLGGRIHLKWESRSTKSMCMRALLVKLVISYCLQTP